MKLCIYAICKNEIKHINDWLECVKEADDVVIVDTGSTDGTWEILQKSGVRCEQVNISPFRFDEARNYALSLIPEDCDICLPLDPDMIITKGYCDKIKSVWKPGMGLLNIPMYFSGANYLGVRFVHARKNCKWVYPAYEQLRYIGATAQYSGVLIIHHYHKGRPAHFMAVELAKLAIEENPSDPYCKNAYELALKDYGNLVKENQ